MARKGIVIALLLGLSLVACTPSVQVPEPVVAEHSRSIEGPFLELSTIDSLMWQRADSALAVMIEFAASPEADSLDVFNGHYCQLLISELLYKNYYGQSNRAELLQAIAYFDSLVARRVRTHVGRTHSMCPYKADPVGTHGVRPPKTRPQPTLSLMPAPIT